MKKILFSGFEPFGQDSINPSLETVKLLKDEKIENVEICIVQTPVVRYKSIETVKKAIEEFNPDIVVTVGQAGGRCDITPERVAINVDDYRIKDNEGNQPIDEKIVQNGPDAYFSTLPIKAMVENMKKEGIPSSVSNTAGTFVCNHLFYGIQDYIFSNNLKIKHGFVHIPLIPEQSINTTNPSMSLKLILKGLVSIAKTLGSCEEDMKVGAGTIC